MPVYEFACRACGEEFEALCLMESDTVTCPSCDSRDLKKKVSRVGSTPGGCYEPSSVGGGG